MAAVEMSDPSMAYPRSRIWVAKASCWGWAGEQVDQGGVGGEADRPGLVLQGPVGSRAAGTLIDVRPA
jgi:hypothetical protein